MVNTVDTGFVLTLKQHYITCYSATVGLFFVNPQLCGTTHYLLGLCLRVMGAQKWLVVCNYLMGIFCKRSYCFLVPKTKIRDQHSNRLGEAKSWAIWPKDKISDFSSCVGWYHSKLWKLKLLAQI